MNNTSRLLRNSRVQLTAPSDAPRSRAQVDDACSLLRSLSLQPIVSADIESSNHKTRLDDLIRALEDPRVNGVFCLRGGFNADDILLDVDFSSVKIPPKLFMGFSDLTNIICALDRRPELTIVHGPLFNSVEFFPDSIKAYLSDFLFEPAETANVLADTEIEIVKEGPETSGVALAGNLFVLNNLIGTRWEPDWNGLVLFVESTMLAGPIVRSIFTHFALCGILSKLSALVVGDLGLEDSERERVFEHLRHLVSSSNLPIVSSKNFGHVPENHCIPCGVRVRILGSRIIVDRKSPS